MSFVALLGIGLLSLGAGEYSRSLDAGSLDQPTLDAEGYGEKSAFRREEDGLRIVLDPGKAETGWKTPAQLRIGGDFTIEARFVLRSRLPKPAQKDGAAVGLAIATQSIDQPDATLLRLIELDDSDVYRPVSKENGAGATPRMIVQPFPQPGGKPPEPPRPTFPAEGDSFRLEMRREGGTVRFQVNDAASEQSRYIGQAEIGPGDIAALKLFGSNRNGAGAVDVVLRGLTIRADRISGLGTTVRTVFGRVVYGDPTGLEDGTLLIGDTAATPASGSTPAQPAQPATTTEPTSATTTTETVAITVQAVPAQVVAPAGLIVKQAIPAVPIAPAAPPPLVETPSTAAQPATPAPAADSPPSTPESAKPKAKLPLDEVERIQFERTPALGARVLGQPNVDVTGPHPTASGAEDSTDKSRDEDSKDDAPPANDRADDLLAPPPGTAAVEKVAKAEPETNGIRDLHLGLWNLRDADIQQVTVNCQTDAGATSWRLDTTDSRDWPLVVRRSGREPWADLFLEPPPGDSHQKSFTVNLTYSDGQSASANVQSEEHSNPKLAFDPEASPPPILPTRVVLADDDRLFGTLDRIGEDSLRLTTPWRDTIDVPLTRIAGIHLALPGRKETPESFARRLEDRGAEDLLLARTKDGEVVAIPGIVEGTEGDRLRFLYQGEGRTLPLNMVEGLVLAERPLPEPPEGPRASFELPGEIVVTGRWVGIDAANWKVETAWGQTLTLPAAEVQAVRFRGGLMTYLSDIEPSRVEEVPFLGHRLPWRRDVNLRGGPLSIAGRAYPRGLAVHSRCVLTYDLDGRYATFRAVVGFDDTIRDLGRVDCRVLADDRELYANPDLRADGPPVELSLPVSGARRLRLVVDYGAGQGAGDRLIWADARLFRRAPPPEPDAPAVGEAGGGH